MTIGVVNWTDSRTGWEAGLGVCLWRLILTGIRNHPALLQWGNRLADTHHCCHLWRQYEQLHCSCRHDSPAMTD